MKVNYKKCKHITERPCLMTNDSNEIFLVTDGLEIGKIFVTRLYNTFTNEIHTWQSDLKNYRPLPKGTKVEIIN